MKVEIEIPDSEVIYYADSYGCTYEEEVTQKLLERQYQERL